MAKSILTHNLSEPLGAAGTARIEIDPGDGNLMIDSLTGGEQQLTRAFGKAYQDYLAGVDRLIPFKRPAKPAHK